MSRRKSGAELLPWLSAKPDCKEGRFIQVGNSLMLSGRFSGLSVGGRWTYLCMCLEAAGKAEFEFPLSAAKKYSIPSTSLRRYIDELHKKGFISVVSNGSVQRMPNRYRFEAKWKVGAPKASAGS